VDLWWTSLKITLKEEGGRGKNHSEIWWKYFVKTKWKTVELNISGIHIESPELAGPRHTSVFLGDMPREGMVQKRCHNNCDNDWRTKKYIENIVELHPPPQQVI
jgi:hypothetical protein